MFLSFDIKRQSQITESTYLRQHQRTHSLGNSVHWPYNVSHSIVHRPEPAHFPRRNSRSVKHHFKNKRNKKKIINKSLQRIDAIVENY